jgi:hypothetical protein
MLRWGAFLFGLFHVYTNMFASLSELWFAAIHFGGFCALFALGNNERAGLSRVQKSINFALAVLAVSAAPLRRISVFGGPKLIPEAMPFFTSAVATLGV